MQICQKYNQIYGALLIIADTFLCPTIFFYSNDDLLRINLFQSFSCILQKIIKRIKPFKTDFKLRLLNKHVLNVRNIT